jgi:carbamoyl-phosphate synthase large subunit
VTAAGNGALKRILVTGAGGTPATNFVRSLRAGTEPMHLVGTDSNKYYLTRAETDERYLVPPARDPAYLPILNDLIRETGCEFVHAQNDEELAVISANRDALAARIFLPAEETVEICLNKHASYERWRSAGLPQPETVIVHDEDDLRGALRRHGTVWLRDTTGAAGRGALAADDVNVARAWLDVQRGWGTYTAAECLQPDSVTWMSLWNDGDLVVAQGRRRLYWELGRLAPAGVTGVTGTGVTVSDPEIDAMALRAVRAIDERPNGVFSVDLTYDQRGIANPTEINIGRFFTTHEFFTRAGLNMPSLLVMLAWGEDLPDGLPAMNPLPPGLAWVRGVDFLPHLTTLEEIEAGVAEYERRSASLTPRR